MLGTLRARVIDCEITTATPAGELVGLYHERWEIETAYLELKSSIVGGWVLRARTANGIEQEVYAQLVVYQLLRTAMADAASTIADIDQAT